MIMKPIYLAGAISLAMACLSCSRKSESAGMEVPVIDVAEAVTDSVTIHKTYPGYLTATKSVDVIGRVNGTILSQNYSDGQMVKKGMVLFRIDDVQYRHKLSEARASLATAQSAYDYNKKHYGAVSKAFEGDAVSQMDLIQAESDYRQSEASVKNAEAQLATASTFESYCTVTAPISGHITTATYNPGAYISGEAAPVVLATIYQDDVLDAVFSIDDGQYVDMLRSSPEEKAGLKMIPLKFSEPMPHSYTADLYYMSPAIDRSTGTMTLQAELKNVYGELKPGMFVSISLPVGFDREAVLIKDASIATDQLGKYVYVVNDSSKVVYTPIHTGELVNDSMRIVTSGLRPGDRYVTKALLKVRNGMKVKPQLTR